PHESFSLVSPYSSRRHRLRVRKGAVSNPTTRTHGETAWDGTVAVFDPTGHPEAKRAYAWSYERPDGKRRFLAVPHVGGIAGRVRP
ncbi:MAG TPA: hypothetical protein VFI45_00420, partial [Candidatus Acidoferrum sp.]|nr:hypothetical protein [Candidatus Acidoferrum sp.]